MALTGFWYVRHAEDEELERLRPDIDKFVNRAVSDRGIQEVMAAWRTWPAVVHGFGEGHQIDRVNRMFLGAFLAGSPGQDAFYACSRDDLDAATWEIGRGVSPPHVEACFAWVERFPPASLLYVGLGPERSARLPGALGTFALSSRELVEHEYRIRHAHALSPAERADAVARMNKWLEVGSGNGFQTPQVLELLPSIIGSALSKGTGLVSVTVAM
jgi:hypothetical protein